MRASWEFDSETPFYSHGKYFGMEWTCSESASNFCTAQPCWACTILREILQVYLCVQKHWRRTCSSWEWNEYHFVHKLAVAAWYVDGTVTSSKLHTYSHIFRPRTLHTDCPKQFYKFICIYKTLDAFKAETEMNILVHKLAVAVWYVCMYGASRQGIGPTTYGASKHIIFRAHITTEGSRTYD